MCLADIACREESVLLVFGEGMAGCALLYDSEFEGLCGDFAEIFGNDGQREIYSAVAESESVPSLRAEESCASGVGVDESVRESFPASEQKIILEPIVHAISCCLLRRRLQLPSSRPQ